MTNKEFYKRLSIEIIENTHSLHQHHIKYLKVTSLEQTLGIIRSIMIRNNRQIDEAIEMQKQLEALMEAMNIKEGDL